MTQLVLYLVIGAALLYFAFSRANTRRRSLKSVANQLGLEAFDRSLDGEVDGYRITTEHLRRPGHVMALELRLHSAPAGLRLHGSGARSSTVDAFENVFVLHAPVPDAWLSEDRRRTLADLQRLTDGVRLEDRWLEIELATDALHDFEIRWTIQWLVDVGRLIDAPTPDRLPPPVIHSHAGRNGCVTAMIAVPLILLAVTAALVALLLLTGSDEDDRPGAEVIQEAPNLFVDCVNGKPKTPDVDLSACEIHLRDVEDTQEVRDAQRTIAFIDLRKALRGELDPEQVRLAIAAIEELPGVTSREVTKLTYDSGLLADYVSRESFDRDAVLPDVAASVDVLLHSGTTLRVSGHAARYAMLDAARCLEDILPKRPSRNDGTEIYVACGPPDLSRHFLNSSRARLAGLEREPQSTIWRAVGFRADRENSLDFQIAVTAIQLTSPDLVPEQNRFNVEGVFQKLGTPECGTPWTAKDATLAPETLVAALPEAGPLGPRFRLWAARQYAGLGQFDEMHEVLAGIQPQDPEALCAAQLETFANAPTEALARLHAIPAPEDAIDVDRSLALAHAHALLGDWKAARERAAEVLAHTAHGQAHSSAAIVETVAAAELGEPDDLDERFGPIPDPAVVGDQQALEYPVSATRWFAHAVVDDDDARTDRWLAPDKLPLLPGSEWLQLYIASKLAPPDKVDFWLDSLLPTEGFDPYGLIEARRITARLRGDTEGLARWNQLHEEHQGRIQDVSDVRLMRIIRRLSPGSR